MALFIYREARFNKRLDSLKKAGGSPCLAAKKAEEIIQKLADQAQPVIKDESTCTKHGELRVDNCKKFDLGGGYRLICVKNGEDLILPYVGAHDESDRWLENNRGFEPRTDELSAVSPSKMELDSGADAGEYDGPEEEAEYDDILMKRIDDRVLRRVFRGLTGE